METPLDLGCNEVPYSRAEFHYDLHGARIAVNIRILTQGYEREIQELKLLCAIHEGLADCYRRKVEE